MLSPEPTKALRGRIKELRKPAAPYYAPKRCADNPSKTAAPAPPKPHKPPNQLKTPATMPKRPAKKPPNPKPRPT